MSTKKAPQDLLNLLLAQRNTVPDLKDIAQALLSEMGGTHKFAHEWAVQYRAAKKNPAAAGRMLNDMIRVIIMANEMADPGSIEGHSNEELISILKEALNAEETVATNKAGTPTDQSDRPPNGT